MKGEKAVYPLVAQREGIQGEVWAILLISEEGNVENVEVVSGAPILAESVVKACKKFKYKPFIKNGKPIKVRTKMPFDFFFKDKVMEKGVSADRNATFDATTAVASTTSGSSTPTTDSPTAASAAPKRVRVSQGVSQGMLLRGIAPVYPEPAKRNRVHGSVVLRAVINREGRIDNLAPVSGPPELIAAAVGAAQQWRYKPYTLLGEPVEVETQITVNFELR